MATVDDLIQDAQTRMAKSVEHSKTEFNTVRTGRASSRRSPPRRSPSRTSAARRSTISRRGGS